jgi:hypothetical protein
VWRGGFSKHLLQHWQGSKLHLVDPWLEGGPYGASRDDDMNTMLANVEPFEGRYQVHRGYSTVVALNFADDSLDFVYLDALHSYRDMMNDMLAWFPKVRVELPVTRSRSPLAVYVASRLPV